MNELDKLENYLKNQDLFNSLEALRGLRAECARLEREADWLAENCWKKTGCEYIPTKDERGGMWCDECPHEHDCRKCWREAARRAVAVEES